MVIKKTSIVLILIMILHTYIYGQKIDLEYEDIENIEYTYQEIIDYDKYLDTLKTLKISERRFKLIEERLKSLKRDQENGKLNDTFNTTLLLYNGEPEKILIVVGEDTIMKNELNFNKVIISRDCVIRYKDISQIVELERRSGTQEIEIYWLSKKKTAKIKIDLSYSCIEIEAELDLVLEEIYIDGRDEHGLPIPKVKEIKEPDKIIINHINW